MNRREVIKNFFCAMSMIYINRSSHALNQEKYHKIYCHELLVTNKSHNTLKDQSLWFYLPMSLWYGQSLELIKTDASFELVKYKHGHNIIHLLFQNILPWEKRYIKVSSIVSFSNTIGNERIDVINNALTKNHTRDIELLAIKLRKNTLTDSVKHIYDWVVNNMSYSNYSPGFRDIEEIWLNRVGDCTEYSQITLSLLRAVDIPARMIGGYFLPKKAYMKIIDYHNWIEIYIPNDGWVIVDTQKGLLYPNKEFYIADRIYDLEEVIIKNNNRFRIQGDFSVDFI